VCTAFVCRVALPVRAGEIQCRALGAKVEAFDANGRAVVGKVGELVNTEPMPSMPLFFWNDPGDRRYLDSTSRAFRCVAPRRLDQDQRARRLGHLRSFGLHVERGGVRMGTSEFYRVVDTCPKSRTAWSWIPDRSKPRKASSALVVLAPGRKLDAPLTKKLRDTLRGALSRATCGRNPRRAGNPADFEWEEGGSSIKRILSGAPPTSPPTPTRSPIHARSTLHRARQTLERRSV